MPMEIAMKGQQKYIGNPLEISMKTNGNPSDIQLNFQRNTIENINEILFETHWKSS